MIDLDQALQKALEAANASGKRILQGFDEDIAYETKTDPADRVTKVDFDAQRIIQAKLAEEFPDIAFFGEEKMGDGDGDGNGEMRNAHGARWIVDPLDGTMNFTHKLPFCGISIALEEEGKSVLGVLHFPKLDWTFTAIRGQGALKNREQIHVSGCAKLKDALLAEIFSDRESRNHTIHYPPSTGYRKFGSAITSLALVAEGSVDGTIIRCKKWDIAAGALIVTEAGGKITVWEDDEENPRTALTIIASCPGIHEELCTLAEVFGR